MQTSFSNLRFLPRAERKARYSKRLISLLALLLTISIATNGHAQGDPLQKGFSDPPDGAKPRVWWHWMSGNITKEGIKSDLWGGATGKGKVFGSGSIA